MTHIACLISGSLGALLAGYLGTEDWIDCFKAIWNGACFLGVHYFIWRE